MFIFLPNNYSRFQKRQLYLFFTVIQFNILKSLSSQRFFSYLPWGTKKCLVGNCCHRVQAYYLIPKSSLGIATVADRGRYNVQSNNALLHFLLLTRMCPGTGFCPLPLPVRDNKWHLEALYESAGRNLIRLESMVHPFGGPQIKEGALTFLLRS